MNNELIICNIYYIYLVIVLFSFWTRRCDRILSAPHWHLAVRVQRYVCGSLSPSGGSAVTVFFSVRSVITFPQVNNNYCKERMKNEQKYSILTEVLIRVFYSLCWVRYFILYTRITSNFSIIVFLWMSKLKINIRLRTTSNVH